MNSDNVSLVTMMTGPRGSGKTLLMTADMCRRLIRAYLQKLVGEEYERIFSNYPAGFHYYPGYGLPPVYLEPEPLNMVALAVFDKGFYKCHAYIDEIDQWLDRQDWADATQKLTAKSIQLIRKRKMSITATIQSFEWLNSRIQFQTDVIVKCREAAFTPWGRAKHLQLGEVGFTDWRDKSGVLTGYSYDESGKSIPITFQGKRFWDTYDTSYEFDPMDTSTKYTLKRPTKEILLPGAEGYDEGGGGAAGGAYIRDRNFHSEKKNRIDVLVSHAVNDFREQGKFTVPGAEMFDYVNGLAGSNIDSWMVGRALSSMGITRTRRGKYNLYPDDVQIDSEPSDKSVVRDAEELIRNSHDVAVPV